jgi:5'(3')-deoxyribonucleotidase
MKRLYIDMDGVLVDFQSGIDRTDTATLEKYEGHYDDIPGIFARMDPMPGAIEAFRLLSHNYDVYILSTAPWHNPSAWSDKVVWVQRYLGDVAYKRLILSHHKDLCHGDYLIDDRTKHGAGEFCGEHIHFRTDKFPSWQSVLDYLL